ncbi:MAG: stage III sporulation protein AC [Clostridia bacterium]|nr:stage III sporulation protein AC [Clostridia bacterium]
MGTEVIFQIAAIGIIVSVLCRLLVQSGRDEQAFMLSIVGLVVVMLMVVNQVSTLFETVRELFGI